MKEGFNLLPAPVAPAPPSLYGRPMRLLPALVVLLLSACAAAKPPACGFVAHSVLPIGRAGPFAAVASRIDGAPAKLVVDTGAGQTVISLAAAHRARLSLNTRATVRATGIGGTGLYATGRVDKLMLGDIPVRPAMVAVMPMVPLADGNLGMDILGDVDLDIDFPAGTITLYRGTLCPGAALPWNTQAAELRVEALMTPGMPATARPRQLLLAMELNGHPAMAMLDTGAGYSVVSRAFANRIGITDAALETGPSMHLAGLSPDGANGRMWRFEDAQIGTDRLINPIMVVADLPGVPFDVLLGMDYLSMHRVWLSYGARRIFVAHQ